MFYQLLHRVGQTDVQFDGDVNGLLEWVRHYENGQSDEYERMRQIYSKFSDGNVFDARHLGESTYNPESFVAECTRQLGELGRTMATDMVKRLDNFVRLNPHFGPLISDWTKPIELTKLFAGTEDEPTEGRYIDQRYINYLAVNSNNMERIHWRKFEQLTAEFYEREGFHVALGPGRNDVGVDVRVWAPGDHTASRPLCLIQCKRQKDKVDKMTVKALHADVTHERSQYGVIVTTSEISPGARNTIKARGYPIHEVNRVAMSDWLNTLRTPGTGIVRV